MDLSSIKNISAGSKKDLLLQLFENDAKTFNSLYATYQHMLMKFAGLSEGQAKDTLDERLREISRKNPPDKELRDVTRTYEKKKDAFSARFGVPKGVLESLEERP